MIDFLSTNLWLLWVIISVLTLLIELSSGDIYFLCFSVGAIVSLVADLCGAPLVAQIIIWVVASVMCIFFVRPSIVRHLHKGGSPRKSNADALIGAHALVAESIPSHGFGYVKIDGDLWRSRSQSGEAISVGTRVEVLSIDGITLTVTPSL